jgi:large subunit ribosomal protein L16
MLQPKRYKYGNGKQFKGRNRGVAHRGNRVRFGDFGLQSLELGFLTQRQIEAARIAVTRFIKRGGKIWICVFPDKSITKKPLEVRQGKGKGSVEYWVAPIQPGRVIYEISGVDREYAKQALMRASAKLPFKTRFIERLIER